MKFLKSISSTINTLRWKTSVYEELDYSYGETLAFYLRDKDINGLTGI